MVWVRLVVPVLGVVTSSYFLRLHCIISDKIGLALEGGLLVRALTKFTEILPNPT